MTILIGQSDDHVAVKYGTIGPNNILETSGKKIEGKEKKFQSNPKMKQLTLCGSLLAIVGAVIGFTTPATAIPAIYRKTTQGITLPTGNNVPLIIHRVTVPAGPRVINYSVTAVNYYTGEFVRCGLRVNGGFLEQHTAVVGGGLSATNAATISGVAYTNYSGPYTLDLVCSHDGAGTSVPTLDPYAELAVF